MMQHLADIFERLKTVNYYRENFHHRSLLGTPIHWKAIFNQRKNIFEYEKYASLVKLKWFIKCNLIMEKLE